jgi:hypothetical protein
LRGDNGVATLLLGLVLSAVGLFLLLLLSRGGLFGGMGALDELLVTGSYNEGFDEIFGQLLEGIFGHFYFGFHLDNQDL